MTPTPSPAADQAGRPGTIVFDMDGVLCEYRVGQRLELLSALSGRTPTTIRSAIWESGFEERAERGALSADEYLEEFGKRLGHPLTAAEWVASRRAATTPYPKVLAAVSRIAVTHTVAMFTNNPFLLKRELSGVFPDAVGLFGPNAFVSAEVGARKPEPAAFRTLASRLQQRPEAMVFIDDKAGNVAGAREAGLQARQAEGEEAVLRVLAELSSG